MLHCSDTNDFGTDELLLWLHIAYNQQKLTIVMLSVVIRLARHQVVPTSKAL